VLLIRREALAQRVRPAEPLKSGRELGIVQKGIAAAVAADDLEHAGVAVFAAVLNDALSRLPGRVPLTSCESALLTSTHPSVVLTTAGVWSSVFSKFL